MTIAEVITRIEREHGILPLEARTCDGLIYGDTDKDCTGIVLTCNPSAEVLQKAVELGCNLVFCHEPTFYHGYDEWNRMQRASVLQMKKSFLDENGIVVYRDHDQVHCEEPDMVYSGIVKALGWEKYAQDDSCFFPVSGYRIPRNTLGGLAKEICRTLSIDGTRIVGNPETVVEYVGITAHFFGDDTECLNEIDRKGYDVIISLETVDWTIVSYIMDSVTYGRPMGLISPGHFNLEEAGMRMMQGWLEKIIEKEVPVQFVQSGNMYGWIGK